MATIRSISLYRAQQDAKVYNYETRRVYLLGYSAV
jgi:hypothetical protein